MTDIILIAVGVLLAVAAGASVFRIVAGPAILDRMIASDMLVTTLILVLGAEMVYHEHTRNIPIMIVLAAVAVFASMAVARYVSKQGGGKPTVPLKRTARKRRKPQ
jgi:multicomponent Na+:H+ antiporter subunit F